MGDDESVDGSGSETLADRVARLHDELEATEERPVERVASRWISEAQAVAGDAAEIAASHPSRDAVVRDRVGHVVDLLGNVETTGDEVADEHVATARALAEEITAEDDTSERDG